eukprot:gene43391-53878_t
MALHSNLLVRREADRALRRNDYHSLADLMKLMKPLDEEYVVLVAGLRVQSKALNDSFGVDGKHLSKIAPWKALVALSNAHHFLDSDTVRDEFANHKLEMALEPLQSHFASEFANLEACIEAGRLKEAVKILLVVDEILETYNVGLCVACKRGDLTVMRYSCYSCGTSNVFSVSGLMPPCGKCGTVQAIAVTTEVSALAKTFHNTISSRQKQCLQKLYAKASSIVPGIQDVYATTHDDVDSDDDSISMDETSSVASCIGGGIPVKHVWIKRGLQELEEMSVDTQLTQLVGFTECINHTKIDINTLASDVLRELDIVSFFDLTTGTFRVPPHRHLTGSNSDNVAAMREKFQKFNGVKLRLNAAVKHCHDVTRSAIKDSLSRLLEVYREGDSKEQEVRQELDSRFLAFIRVLTSDDSELKHALDLVRMEGLLWLEFLPVKTKVVNALNKLVAKFNVLFSG